jgi:hypothetical protein
MDAVATRHQYHLHDPVSDHFHQLRIRFLPVVSRRSAKNRGGAVSG